MTLKKRLLALCMAVVMVFSLCSISAFAAAPTDDKQPVVIGRYDAPLSECLEPGMAMQVGIANVRVNSYATYGISSPTPAACRKSLSRKSWSFGGNCSQKRRRNPNEQ